MTTFRDNKNVKKFPHNSHNTSYVNKGVGKNSVFESQGPTGKSRGTMQQLLDRYTALGRDALRDCDNVLAEGFFQHAEHYRRLLAHYVKRMAPEETVETDFVSTPTETTDIEISDE